MAAICTAVALVLPVLYTVISLFVLPAIYSDCAAGFEVWDSMQRGAAFNYLRLPDPADISRDLQAFFTYWTPGQYIMPGLLERLGFSLGRAIVLVDGAFSLAGVAGWLILYRVFGFSRRTVAIAVAILACSRHLALPFGYYNGGEVLMFGANPWFFLVVWRLRRFPWIAVPLLLVSALILVFFKLTGVLVAGSAVGAAVLAKDGVWPVTADTLRKAFVAGVMLFVFAIVFYFAWYSRGATPAGESSGLHWEKMMPHAAFAAVAIWGASFSLGDLAAYVLVNPAHPLLSSLQLLGYIMLPFALATFVLVWRTQAQSRPEYLRFVFWMGVSFSGVLLVSWLRGGRVGEYEDRHFLSISLTLLPAVVETFTAARLRALRGCFWTVAAAMSLYGVASFAEHAKQNLRSPVSDRGFRQHNISQAALDFLHSIDRGADAASTVVYVQSKEIGLELQHARAISVQMDFMTKQTLAGLAFHGRVPQLYVLLASRLVDNGKADLILKSFVDYPADAWTKTTLGDFAYFAAGR